MRMSTDHTKPAKKIITAFGGINPAARALGLTASTVQGWWERGFIPAPRQAGVLSRARDLGLDITADDFMGKHPPENAQA